MPAVFREEAPGDPDTDWLFDDGKVRASCTPGHDPGTLDIWVFGLREGVPSGLGHARAALVALRDLFPVLRARGVGDGTQGEAFWTRMGEEGLVVSLETHRKGVVPLSPTGFPDEDAEEEGAAPAP